MNQRRNVFCAITFSLIAMVTTECVKAELSPSKIAELKKNATDIFKIDVQSVRVEKTKAARKSIFIRAKIVSVVKSSSVLNPGDRVSIESYSINKSEVVSIEDLAMLIGPKSPPMLQSGWNGVVYLNRKGAKSSDKTYEIAAFGHSFESAVKRDDTAIEVLIRDLASTDGKKRVAATRLILERGKDALKPLRKAGAMQLTPDGSVFRNRTLGRIDMVYSLIDGLKPSGKLKGYDSDRIGLEVQEGVTPQRVKGLGKVYGFHPIFNHTKSSRRMVAVKLDSGIKLELLIRKLLATEHDLITIKPVYWDRELPRCPGQPRFPVPKQPKGR